MAAGREKEGELSTTSLEFEFLHRRSRCEMLIGGDDISNNVITPGTCFSMLIYNRADWRKSDSSVDGEPQGNWRWNSNSRDVVECSPSFSCPAATEPRRACSQAWLQFCNRHFHPFDMGVPPRGSEQFMEGKVRLAQKTNS